MQNSYRLAERAVLMRLSAGLPGKNRTDKALTSKVKTQEAMGSHSGRWVKERFPQWALEPLEKLVNEARGYHAKVTLPFDNGIGILPAALVVEYGDEMRAYKAKFQGLVETHFVPRYDEMIDWARAEHNGTFSPEDYPGIDEMVECFKFRTEPLPVPDAGHFEAAMTSLLGVDAEGVNIRVADAMQEAQKELMRRLIEPVSAMAKKLKEAPKEGKEDIIFRDTLVDNVKEIAVLAPKLNIAGDAQIDAFVAEMAAITKYSAESLRESKVTRNEVADRADAIAKKMAAYRI